MATNNFYDPNHDETSLPLFKAEAISLDEIKPGCWNYLTVGVYRLVDGTEDYVQVGSYQRNYSSLFNTFYPFVGQDGNWYALYSKHYTATRIMRLPSCEDIGGEDGAQFGFCPTDYYVPCLSGFPTSPGDPKPGSSAPHSDFKAWLDRSYKVVQAPFGFVSGCIWGDDSSDKVEFLDLSEAHHGKLIRDQRFGYHELPDGISRLYKAVTVESNCHECENGELEAKYCSFTIATKRRFDYTGQSQGD